MKFIDVINEQISRKWAYILCAFAYGWGVGSSYNSFFNGLLAFALWIMIFTFCLYIESVWREK